jgi:hypothetical protein
MCCKNPSYDVLINKDPKRQADLCSDTRTSPIWIAQFHFYDGLNQILSWTFRSGFRSSLRAKQKAVFQLLCLLKRLSDRDHFVFSEETR